MSADLVSVPDAASGRLPTLDRERQFASYGSLLYTLMTLTASIWIFLVGSVLPTVGDTRLAIIGFACGVVLGIIPVLLGSALPSFVSGVDTVDASKAALGTRGALLVLLGLLMLCLAWGGVALAMVAEGIGTLIAHIGADVTNVVADERAVIFIAFAILLLLVALLRSGLTVMRRLNALVGPGFVILATLSLVLLARNFGLRELWLTNVPLDQALTGDPRKSFAYALEFGVTLSLAWWPMLGGLYRFVRYRRHTTGPMMIGGALIGSAFSGSVAALAAVHLGTADPVVWLMELAGAPAGRVMVSVVLLLSISAIGTLLYFAVIAVQQLRSLARLSWTCLVWLTVAPLSLVAFNTSWTLTHVITIATYGSLLFVSLSGIVAVDYWVLRRQRLELEQLFVAGPCGHYWFWGGVNWVAIAVAALGIAVYLWLYDPVTLEAATAFRYFGAALPVILSTAILYYVLMRLIALPAGRGGYPRRGEKTTAAGVVEVQL